jgi:hypothetical protein
MAAGRGPAKRPWALPAIRWVEVIWKAGSPLTNAGRQPGPGASRLRRGDANDGTANAGANPRTQPERDHLTNLGIRHYSLGDNQQAIDLDTQALTVARDLGDRHGEGMQ